VRDELPPFVKKPSVSLPMTGKHTEYALYKLARILDNTANPILRRFGRAGRCRLFGSTPKRKVHCMLTFPVDMHLLK